MPGSEGGGWKRARKSNALTAYPTPERVCPKVRAKPHKSRCSSRVRAKVEAWKRRPEPPVLQPGESSDSITGIFDCPDHHK